MSGTPDFTIIGGGISGLLTARELIEDGASVTIIDQNKSGRESSWAGSGILLPIYPWRQDQSITRLVIESLKIYPGLIQEIYATTGIDPEWITCGLLITKNPDIKDAINWCETNRIAYATPDPSMLAGIHTRTTDPLWLPDIAQVRNPRLLRALRKYLESRQVTFIEDCQLQGVDISAGYVHSISTSNGKFPVNHLILATGAWSGEIWKNILPQTESAHLDVQPVKGQILLFDAEPGLLDHMILDGGRYLIPRQDGKILAGSTVEHTGFNKETTKEARNGIETFATSLLPDLKKYPITHHWAGLRPGTSHGIPYIDNHPEIDNLSVNCGHFRNGFIMGPASARLLVDMINNRTPAISKEPYSLIADH